MNVLTLIFGSMLTENLFFGKLCGSVYGLKPVCVKDSARIGLLALIVSTLSALIVSLLARLVLVPINAAQLQILVFAAVAMLLTQAAYRIIKERNFECGRLWLPVFVGSMTIGIAAQIGTDVFAGVLKTLCFGAGYLIVLVLMTGVRERLTGSKIPECLKGLPISLITAGLMTLAFMGFVGLA